MSRIELKICVVACKGSRAVITTSDFLNYHWIRMCIMMVKTINKCEIMYIYEIKIAFSKTVKDSDHVHGKTDCSIPSN